LKTIATKGVSVTSKEGRANTRRLEQQRGNIVKEVVTPQ